MGKILGWVLGNPKIAGGILLLIIGGTHFAHYTYLKGKVDRLETQKTALTSALEVAHDTVRIKDEALRIEREAIALVTRQRNNARRALDEFSAGREDPVAIEWAAQPIPESERARMCIAVPQLEGC